MKFQKLQSKYVSNISKNGQHKNGNSSFNKFNTLPSHFLKHNNVDDDNEDVFKVINCCINLNNLI